MLHARWPRFLLGLIILVSLGILAFGEKPWNLAADAQGWKDDVTRGLYWGAAANALIAAALIFTSNLWLAPLGRPPVPPDPDTRHKKWFWPLLIGAVVLAGLLRYPLASKSLWWDELWQTKQASHGYEKPLKDDPTQFKFSPTSWKRCAWYQQKPTNHVPAALAAKASIALHHKFTDIPAKDFSDFSARFPTYLTSLASILAAGLLLRRWGFTGGGIFAAFLLALHPWHIRYGIDVRGFSYLVLWTLLACGSLTSLLSTRRWRPWLFHGLLQFLLMWSLPNAFWYAGALFLTALLLIPTRWRTRRDRKTAYARLVAVNTLAALAFIAVYAPNITQILRWMDATPDPHYLDWRLAKETLAQLTFGTPLSPFPGFPALTGPEGSPVWLWFPVALVLLAAVLLGNYRFLTRNPLPLAAFTGIFLVTILYCAFTIAKGHHFYPRYLIYLLPPLILLAGTGLAMKPLPGTIVLVLFALATAPQTKLLIERPYAPLRNLADRFGDAPATGVGLGSRILQTYAPQVIPVIHSPADEQLKAAILQNPDAPVFYGYEGFNKATLPSAFEVIDTLGEPSETLHGIEPDFTFKIYRSVKSIE